MLLDDTMHAAVCAMAREIERLDQREVEGTYIGGCDRMMAQREKRGLRLLQEMVRLSSRYPDKTWAKLRRMAEAEVNRD